MRVKVRTRASHSVSKAGGTLLGLASLHYEVHQVTQVNLLGSESGSELESESESGSGAGAGAHVKGVGVGLSWPVYGYGYGGGLGPPSLASFLWGRHPAVWELGLGAWASKVARSTRTPWSASVLDCACGVRVISMGTGMVARFIGNAR